MTEHTDKAPEKSGKKPPSKRAGRPRAPGGKQAKAPGSKTAAAETVAPEKTSSDNGGTEKAAGTKTFDPNYPGPKTLAPDPATITFGSNRPIVAAPPKLPESSGLKFAGPSAGELKASGPQPTSPKASGLTFTSAKSGTSTKLASTNGIANAGKEPLRKPEAKAPETKTPEVKKPEAMKPDTKAPQIKAAQSKTGESKPVDPKKPTTKPAIAPPVSVRRFDKERSTSGFVVMLFVLTLLGGGLAVWMKLGSETPPASVTAPQEATVMPAAPEADAPATAAPGMAAEPAAPEAPVRFGRSVRAPETPGPLAAATAEGAAMAANDGLTAEEIGEIQHLLGRLDFNPGSEAGVLTAETVAAIRSYQEMAGLPTDGEANAALLEELRTVVELYGG
jgi:hypothetical protein